MPNCCKCNKQQSRLNKGGLCKSCFHKKINPATPNDNNESILNNNNGITDVNYDDQSNDRTMIDIIKQNMLNERKWNEDMQIILKEQLEFLRQEMVVKNTLIERLMDKLHEKGINNNNIVSDSTLSTETNESTSETLNATITEALNGDNSFRDHTYIPSETFGNESKTQITNTNEPYFSTNKFAVLINDSSSSFENEYEKAEVCKRPIRKKDYVRETRPNVVINEYPENDKVEYKQPKLVPGNSTYANISSQGRKILILSDSTLSRLQMKKLNNDINIGRAYRKCFPGATPSEMVHYCLPTLRDDKPDIVVIHTGTNSLFRDDTQDIANEVLNIVNICRNHGVSEIFVSGITFRKPYLTKIIEFNNYMNSMKLSLDFRYINNDNIYAKDIGKDNIHLNYSGIGKIANNIINAINALHIT